LKLQNNKNLYKERNIFFEKFCESFKEDVDKILKNFDFIRDEEKKYQKRWTEVIQALKGIN
jgi:hypothetical protein